MFANLGVCDSKFGPALELPVVIVQWLVVQRSVHQFLGLVAHEYGPTSIHMKVPTTGDAASGMNRVHSFSTLASASSGHDPQPL